MIQQKDLFGSKDKYEADIKLLFEAYHDGLLLVIWKIFPDWKIAEEILNDVYNSIKQNKVTLPDDEEQSFTTLAKICKKRTIENIPFM